MTVAGAWLFDFDVEPTTEDSVVECPGCHEPSALREWVDTEVYCEDCGSHSAMGCPKCDEEFDHVNGPTFHVQVVESGS